MHYIIIPLVLILAASLLCHYRLQRADAVLHIHTYVYHIPFLPFVSGGARISARCRLQPLCTGASYALAHGHCLSGRTHPRFQRVERVCGKLQGAAFGGGIVAGAAFPLLRLQHHLYLYLSSLQPPPPHPPPTAHDCRFDASC